ncbi:MAG: aminoglycoside phosphotransferase family protein [Nannocystaceae bacterium]
MHPLAEIAASAFGRTPQTELPVTDSFGSEVLRFVDADGHQYVVKRPWSRPKAVKEARALTRLVDHPRVPRLLGVHERGEHAYLLLEGLEATPWSDIEGASEELVREVGRAVRKIHDLPEESFEGRPRWHALLGSNAHRYRELVRTRPADARLAADALDLLQDQLTHVPNSNEAVLVHFDLRPGNILVHDGRLVGIIDFESCRGGHPSMDLFKIWQQVWARRPVTRDWFMAGYTRDDDAAGWAHSTDLDRLMQTYALYHGLAGLAWCEKRGQIDGPFATVNRELIDDARRFFGC